METGRAGGGNDSGVPVAAVVAGLLVLAVLGGVLGAWWTTTRTQEFESRARVSFIDWVEPGAIEAERGRIISLAGGESELDQSVEAATIVLDVPEGRNFIDVVATASSAATVAESAGIAAAKLVDVEREAALAAIDTEIEVAQLGLDAVAASTEALATEMEILLNAEAKAEAMRATAEGEAIEEWIIASREASREYWDIARVRNARLDEQSSFDRELIRLANDRLAPPPIEVTEPPTSPIATVDTSPALGFLGGAGAGIGVALIIWALVYPSRTIELSGNENASA